LEFWKLASQIELREDWKTLLLGLIAVRKDYSIGCSEKEFQRLRAIGWHGGETEFKEALRDEILFPPKKAIYSSPEYLEFGQKLRGWIN
jgi:hypothetical protein